MKKLYLKLQTPVVEIPISCIDAGGKKDSIKIGFKRPLPENVDSEKEEYNSLMVAMESDGSDTIMQDIRDFISKRILYIKDNDLTFEDEKGGLIPLKVPDTRKETSREGFWENEEECLQLLSEMYLAADCWLMEIIAPMASAISNSKVETTNVKN